jgi:hypothetical protein
MALVGLDLFRERFVQHNNSFVLIGGTACLVAMELLGLEFRATKDLDIVLCQEHGDPGFARVLWAFIREGGYAQRETSSGRREYHRFAKPTAPGYPAMIELFARAPEALNLAEDQHLIPAIRTIDETGDPLSLSAILLDNDYYGWLRTGRLEVNGLPIVRAEHLIPLKARAWLDLSARLKAGEAIDQKDIRKHRNDVVRLSTIIDPDYRVEIPTVVRTDMTEFITALPQTQLDLPALGLKKSSIEALQRMLTERYCPGL